MTKSSDQASAALIKDLKQRGLLEDTLVVWGGEFGRTCFSQGKLTKEKLRPATTTHGVSACGWPAGGVKPGLVYGKNR